MKRILLSLFASIGLWAQTPALPHDGAGAILWYNGGQTPRWNGSFFQFVQAPGANAGTYIYNSFDILDIRKGQFMAVPSTGLAQHILWIANRIEVFGLGQIGVSIANVGGGANETAAFGGGGGLSIPIKGGWSIQPTLKVINAQDQNTLVGGLGFHWGH